MGAAADWVLADCILGVRTVRKPSTPLPPGNAVGGSSSGSQELPDSRTFDHRAQAGLGVPTTGGVTLVPQNGQFGPAPSLAGPALGWTDASISHAALQTTPATMWTTTLPVSLCLL